MAGRLSSSRRYRVGGVLERVDPCGRSPDANPGAPPDGTGTAADPDPDPSPEAAAAVAGTTSRPGAGLGADPREVDRTVLPCRTAIERIGHFCREKGSFARKTEGVAKTSAAAGGADRAGSTGPGQTPHPDGTRRTAIGGVENLVGEIGKRQSRQSPTPGVCGSAHGCGFCQRRKPDVVVGDGVLPQHQSAQ